MKYKLIFVFFSLSIFGFSQIDGNNRSSYDAVSQLLDAQRTKKPFQTNLLDGILLIAPTQEELLKLNRVKTKTVYYEGSTLIHYFDTSGVLTKIESKDGEEISFEVYTYAYNSGGKVIKQVIDNLDDTGTIREFQYDDQDRIIAKSYSTFDGEPSYRNMYYNDDLAVMIEVSGFGVDKYYYDQNGLRMFFQSYDETFRMVGTSTSTYNNLGLKSEESSRAFGMEFSDSFLYNERGQLEYADRRSAFVSASWSHEYNELGLEIKYKNESTTFESETLTNYTFYE